MEIFAVPQEKKKRVILDTDAKNEVDDQFAIVQALLSESLELKGMIAAHFEPAKSATSEQDSYEEIHRILGMMGKEGEVPVWHGAKAAMETEIRPADSEGARQIIFEAMKEEERPLYLAFLGPLTDLAAAILLEPAIVTRNIKVIWIGGGRWPEGGYEYNLKNDVAAANVVFSSGMEVWQIPRDVYRRMPVSFAELYTRVRPCGTIGAYLCDQVIAFNNQNIHHPGEYRILGDSPAIGVLLYEDCGSWEMRPAPAVDEKLRYVQGKLAEKAGKQGGQIRVYQDMNARFILEDLYAKLHLFARKTEEGEA